MTDNDIIIELSKFKKIPWKLLNNDIKYYLSNRYKDIDDIKESYFRIKNNIEESKKCKYCNNKVHFLSYIYGYSETCNNKECINKLIKEKREKTLLKKYGVINAYQSELIKEKIKKNNITKYGYEYPMQNKTIKEKAQNTCLEKYGVKNVLENKTIMDNAKKTRLHHYPNYINDKQISTNLNKYGCISPFGNKDIREKSINSYIDHFGVDNPNKCKDIRKKTEETCLKKYGVKSYILTDECKAKAHSLEAIEKGNKTKKKNNTYIKLIKIFDNVLRQYKSELYPFNCDFYIPSLDLYIECNYFWMHGNKLFDENNKNDILILNSWINKSKQHKAYKQAIYTWTKLDVKKFNIAKRNNLNYLIFYSFNDFLNWFNKYELITNRLKQS